MKTAQNAQADGYQNDHIWKAVQSFLPVRNRLSTDVMPDEYFLSLDGMNVHIDHYRVSNPKATVVMFHGVGGNGRLLSFIAVGLNKIGYEVICPDLPLYGYTEYSTTITYDTWVRCGRDIVSYYQSQQERDIFLFGLSAGGMLAYQVACECKNIRGILVSCILDQRNPVVTRGTTITPAVGFVAKPMLAATHRIFGRMRVPMKMVGNMRAIANNGALVALLTKDRKASGVSVPVSFIHSMLNPIIKTEPERFMACPFLLVHPGDDRWTDVSLSRLFYDRLGCEKELRILDGAGHFPIEERGLRQLEECSVRFIEKTMSR
jgi:alpha-beta hydrolase superfamily lysophospholipase